MYLDLDVYLDVDLYLDVFGFGFGCDENVCPNSLQGNVSCCSCLWDSQYISIRKRFSLLIISSLYYNDKGKITNANGPAIILIYLRHLL